jgi:polysaccharide pyruvyl transferase WcaK-like protein
MRISENYITLIDPATGPNGGITENSGDCIIYASIQNLMKELFPEKEIVRISAHQAWGPKEKELIRKSYLSFAAGSNMLTSDIRNFPRFTPVKKKGFYLFPGVERIILLGVGWYRYQQKPDLPTRFYYRNILNKTFIHSVRDSYAINQLSTIRTIKVKNTSCPTVWKLDPTFINKFNSANDYTLLTLNNNYPDPEADSNIIRLIIEHTKGPVVFFPQVQQDLPYLESLPIYKNNRKKFLLLDQTYQSFTSFADQSSFNYIGTRLHAGIASLQRSMPALIQITDNRAAEIARDIRLFALKRNELSSIENWIKDGYVPAPLSIPFESINEWKSQFQNNH